VQVQGLVQKVELLETENQNRKQEIKAVGGRLDRVLPIIQGNVGALSAEKPRLIQMS
jgi:hypothetical protein